MTSDLPFSELEVLCDRKEVGGAVGIELEAVRLEGDPLDVTYDVP